MKTELLKKIKLLLLGIIIFSFSSCYTDLTYGIRNNPDVRWVTHSDYQKNNLRNFKSKKYKRLVKGKRLHKKYYIYMRPYGGEKKLRLPKYNND